MAELSSLAVIQHPNLCRISRRRKELRTIQASGFGGVRSSALDNLPYRRPIHVTPLDWRSRAGIALGVAQGLSFLHEFSPAEPMYGCFQTCNVQIDRDFMPRLTDYCFAHKPPPSGTPKPLRNLSSQTCQICGDSIEVNKDGEPVVACNECAFPVCRTCYDYECQEGNQVCPQCKTRYKRHKGCRRVEGDKDEDDIDDLENEFEFADRDKLDRQYSAEAMLHGHMSYGRGVDDADVLRTDHMVHSQVPLKFSLVVDNFFHEDV